MKKLRAIDREVIITQLERDNEAISECAREIILSTGISQAKIARAMDSTPQYLNSVLSGHRGWTDSMIAKFNKAIARAIREKHNAKNKKKKPRRIRRPNRIPICGSDSDNPGNDNIGNNNGAVLQRPGLDDESVDVLSLDADHLDGNNIGSDGKDPHKEREEVAMDGDHEAQQEFYEKATECLSEIEGLQEELNEILEGAGIGVASWQKDEVQKACLKLDEVIECLKSTQPE